MHLFLKWVSPASAEVHGYVLSKNGEKISLRTNYQHYYVLNEILEQTSQLAGSAMPGWKPTGARPGPLFPLPARLKKQRLKGPHARFIFQTLPAYLDDHLADAGYLLAFPSIRWAFMVILLLFGVLRALAEVVKKQREVYVQGEITLPSFYGIWGSRSWDYSLP